MAVLFLINGRLQPIQFFLAGHGVHRAIDMHGRYMDHFVPLACGQGVIVFLSIIVEYAGNTLGIADTRTKGQGGMHEPRVDVFQVVRIANHALGQGIDTANQLGCGVRIDFRAIRADSVL